MSRPKHTKATRLRLAPAVLGLGAVVALSGCATGQQAETSEQTAAIYGANGNVKHMAVRNATLTFPDGEPYYPKGSTAPVDVVLINEAMQQDRLVEVSSSYAASAKISGKTTIPGGTRLYSDGVRAGQSSDYKPTSLSEGAGPADPKPVGPVQRPQVNISLVGLTQNIRPGVTIPVTFTFARAGSTTVYVPIGPSGEPRPPAQANPGGHGSGGHGGGQSGSGQHGGSQQGHSGGGSGSGSGGHG